MRHPFQSPSFSLAVVTIEDRQPPGCRSAKARRRSTSTMDKSVLASRSYSAKPKTLWALFEPLDSAPGLTGDGGDTPRFDPARSRRDRGPHGTVSSGLISRTARPCLPRRASVCTSTTILGPCPRRKDCPKNFRRTFRHESRIFRLPLGPISETETPCRGRTTLTHPLTISGSTVCPSLHPAQSCVAFCPSFPWRRVAAASPSPVFSRMRIRARPRSARQWSDLGK